MRRRFVSPRAIARSSAPCRFDGWMLAALSLGAAAVPVSGANPQHGLQDQAAGDAGCGPGRAAWHGDQADPHGRDRSGAYRYEAIPDGISWTSERKKPGDMSS
jgi:hypothetical protein